MCVRVCVSVSASVRAFACTSVRVFCACGCLLVCTPVSLHKCARLCVCVRAFFLMSESS